MEQRSLGKLIERTIKSAAARFRKSLERHYPAEGKNGFNERNLTFQFAHEFCRRKGSHAFFEVPFVTKGRLRKDNHFDAMLFNSDHLLIVESKRLFSRAKSESVIADIRRICRKGHITSLRHRFEKPHRAPNSTFGLILAEHWEENASEGKVIEWWLGKTKGRHWDRDGYPEKWTYGYRPIISYPLRKRTTKDSTVHWLYCYGPLD